MRNTERFQRPHCYSFTVGLFTTSGDAINCAPGGARLPVRLFLVQSDIGNGGIVTIGDATVSLLNGIQLDPGRAIQFSVGNQDLVGSLYPTTMNWQEALDQSRIAAAGLEQANPEMNLFLDIADFFVASDAALPQRVRVFWSTIVT